MIIEGVSSSLFSEINGKTNQSKSTQGSGQAFMESFTQVAQGAQMVVRGSELGAAGLHDRKMVKDPATNMFAEQEESLDDIYNKIKHIDEILQEKFSQ